MSDSVCSNQEARSSSLSCSCEPQGLAAFSFSRLCLRTLLPEASVFPRREWGNEGLLVGWGVSCLVMEEVPSTQLAPPPSAPSSLGCRSSTVFVVALGPSAAFILLWMMRGVTISSHKRKMIWSCFQKGGRGGNMAEQRRTEEGWASVLLLLADSGVGSWASPREMGRKGTAERLFQRHPEALVTGL